MTRTNPPTQSSSDNSDEVLSRIEAIESIRRIEKDTIPLNMLTANFCT